MTTGEFRDLVERYRLGACTPEEETFVAKWMTVHGRVNDADLPGCENEGKVSDLEEEIWEGIVKDAGIRKEAWWQRQAYRWIFAGIAASLGLLILGLGLFNTGKMSPVEPGINGIETVNTSTIAQRILLPDSSVVILSEGASLSTAEDYGKGNRTVFLKGEAYFDVKSNSRSPFLVYYGDLVTEVIGTSFTIKPLTEAKSIEVSVSSGKVSVYSNGKNSQQRRSGVIITRNQRAIFDTESKSIRPELVDEPQIQTEGVDDSAFFFDDAPVGEILETLSQVYGMEIVVTNTELNSCRFTGDLRGFDLFKQLDYVCTATGSRYDIRGTSFFVTGEGCSQHSNSTGKNN